MKNTRSKAGSQDGLDMRHGTNCEKVEHGSRCGYLHDSEDDSPFSVDGVYYCGRCHHVMPHITE